MQTGSTHIRSVGVAIRSGRRLFRDALAAWLSRQSEFVVVGHVADERDLIQLCDLRRPDLVLFDAGSLIGPALEPLRALRARFERLRVVVVYERLSPADHEALHTIGVDTLVPSSHGLEALLVVLRQHLGTLDGEVSGPDPADAGLTKQEQAILSLIGGGHTVRRIAELLGLTPWAVENSKRRIHYKLDVASQSQAVARAAALGLMDRPAPAEPVSIRTGRVTLAVLRGPAGDSRYQAVVALLAGGIPFVIDDPAAADRSDPRSHWHAGPVMLILVDPAPQDWEKIDNTPTLLIRTQVIGRGAALAALARGVVGILAADRISDALVPALLLGAVGHLTVDPAVAPALVSALHPQPGEPDGRLPELTAREADILRSIAMGHTVRQTARLLDIAEKTVENTQARLFLKLGTRNRAGAIAAAHGLGLLDLVTDRQPGDRPPERPSFGPPAREGTA